MYGLYIYFYKYLHFRYFSQDYVKLISCWLWPLTCKKFVINFMAQYNIKSYYPTICMYNGWKNTIQSKYIPIHLKLFISMRNKEYTQYVIKNTHNIKPTYALMLKLCFLHTVYHNYNMFQTIFIILRELKNMNESYVYGTVHHLYSWVKRKPTWCHLFYYLFNTHSMLNMFRPLIRPSSGVCD